MSSVPNRARGMSAEERAERRRDALRRRRRLRNASAVAVAIAAGALAAVALLAPPGQRGATHSVTQIDHRRVRRRVRDPRASTAAVPILMYHVIASAPAGAPFPGLYVPRAEFVAQMRSLAQAGYHAVTLDRVWNAWRGEARLPPRPVVLSFDNGYRTQYTVARPVLQRFGWVGDENLQLIGLPPKQGGLGRPEVRALVAAGWELDTQGYSHADLIRLDARQPQQASQTVLFLRCDFHRRRLSTEVADRPLWTIIGILYFSVKNLSCREEGVRAGFQFSA